MNEEHIEEFGVWRSPIEALMFMRNSLEHMILDNDELVSGNPKTIEKRLEEYTTTILKLLKDINKEYNND